jgi:hypothetical protein
MGWSNLQFALPWDADADATNTTNNATSSGRRLLVSKPGQNNPLNNLEKAKTQFIATSFWVVLCLGAASIVHYTLLRWLKVDLP